MIRPFTALLASSAIALLSFSPLRAETTSPGLQARIDALLPEAGQHGFELGLVQLLRGVEKSLQTRYATGLGDTLLRGPLMRIDVKSNPRQGPDPAPPETIANIFRTFMDDLAQAQTYLGQTIGADARPFELTLQDLWFDVDADGQRGADEGVVETLSPLILSPRDLKEFAASEAARTPITIRFDAADHAWLSAYTYMLSGFGSAFLAFDPTPVLADLAAGRAALKDAPELPAYYDPVALEAEIAALEAEQGALLSRIDALKEQEKLVRDQQETLWEQAKATEDAAQKQALTEKAEALNAELEPVRKTRGDLQRQQRQIRGEIEAAKAKLPGAAPRQSFGMEREFDLLYAVLTSLRQQPDAAHLRAAREDWREMIAQNRLFWAALATETDNDREWIANANQSSALPITIPEGAPEAWQKLLSDAEAVLEGKLLIPHSLLPDGYGISLAAYLENPGPIDLLDWIHGRGAYPYAARGPVITRQYWNAFARMTNGNAAGFALFFN
jgi:hypothetical protein